jgi:hypothetical protein
VTQEKRGRWLRAAAIVVACIGIGTVSGLASAQVRDNVRRHSLLEAAHAELEMISLRLELARAHFGEVMKQVKIGAAGQQALADAEAELRAMEARTAKARLNIEEIRSTAQPPRDELTAPLVTSRDYVSERIMLELAGAQERLTAAERALGEVNRRVAIGTVSEAARAESEIELVRSRAALAVLMDRRNLRREFVEKGTAADDLARRFEAAQLRTELEVAEASLRQAKVRLESVIKQNTIGTATRLEVMRAEVELRERELEMEQLLRRRQRLDAVRRDSQSQ